MEELLLIITIILIAAGFVAVLRRRRRARLDPRSIEEQDLLKHLFHLAEKGVRPGVESLAGSLHRQPDDVAAVLERLTARGFLAFGADGISLTRHGQERALEVVRTHRLWERFLAERTGVSESDWHTNAERAEHRLSPSQTDALSRSLGNPLFDPHGDPIPQADGALPPQRGGSLSRARVGTAFLVIHVEDEPPSVYAELMAKRIVPGVRLTVVETGIQGVVVEAEGERHRLSALAAGNVTVSPTRLRRPSSVALRTLADLPVGASARVAEISPTVRGMQRRRLLDLGLVPGTEVRTEFVSPTGDPTAYSIRGALVALRSSEASLILMEHTR